MVYAASRGARRAEAVGGRPGSGSSMSRCHPGPQLPHLQIQLCGQDPWFLTEGGAGFAARGHLAASGEICVCHSFGGGAWCPAGGDRVALTSLPFAGLGVSAAPGCTSVTPASFRPPAQGYPGTCFFLRGHPVTSRMRVHLSARWDRCGRTAVPRLTQALGVGATEPQPAPPP